MFNRISKENQLLNSMYHRIINPLTNYAHLFHNGRCQIVET